MGEANSVPTPGGAQKGSKTPVHVWKTDPKWRRRRRPTGGVC